MRTLSTLAFFAVGICGSAKADSLFENFSPPGRVFAMSNEVVGNRIVIYARSSTGALTQIGTAPTGGAGSGTGLGSQGALTLSNDRAWLLAVNAGSDELSVFRVFPFALILTDVVPSGGDRPVSVTIKNDLVYVLNGGAPNNVTGFRLSNTGQLTTIANSARALSAAMTGPAQVEISPNGSRVVVTEKATSLIDVFALGSDGLLGPIVSQPSPGMTPFGFQFRNSNQFIVSEAFGGAADASAVSSHRFTSTTNFSTISASVPTHESAACWIAITRNDRFAYTTNTGSDTISGYEVNGQGQLTALDSDGVTAVTGDGPTDLAFSFNSRFLYAVNGAAGTISAFRRFSNGTLVPVGAPFPGLPSAGAVGIAGF